MKITHIDVKISSDPSVVAYVKFTLEGEFLVTGVRVVRRRDGDLLVSMPSVRHETGGFFDVCHPLNSVFRDYVDRTILRAVHGMLSPTR